ncbi:MAG: 4Fe-4S dicluster domain-containing protein [Candidatus Heimdallarchaeota archaeon]
MPPKSILVIGGGLSGVFLAQELADFGYKLNLVEKLPSIGGILLDLGKVFPTDDCALCYPSAARFTDGGFRKCQFRTQVQFHPKINLFTNSELETYERNGGKFHAVIRKRRFGIYESKCVGCGECITACQATHEEDTQIPIRFYHSQAVPRVPYISKEDCDRCGKCIDVCEPGAINFDWEDETIELDADVVVFATGFQEMTPYTILREFGYGELPRVITQVELAHFLDPLRVKGKKDLDIDQKTLFNHVVMITCIGSRDQRYYAYCSRICCTYTLKHALMLREKDIEVTVCFMDIRTPGFIEDYYLRCRAKGVNFIRGRPNLVEWDAETESLVVEFEDTLAQQSKHLQADLVVLATALFPRHTDRYTGNELETTVEGEFKAGSMIEPRNIPETIRDVDALCLRIVKYLGSP